MKATNQTRILFICTGNIYRSRYAEAYLNHLAHERELPMAATSRGLRIQLVTDRISPYAKKRLEEKGTPLQHTSADREALTEADLENADVIVALKESEHRPMMAQQFPAWADRITYWRVSDLDEWDDERALSEIERSVTALVEEAGG